MRIGWVLIFFSFMFSLYSQEREGDQCQDILKFGQFKKIDKLDLYQKNDLFHYYCTSDYGQVKKQLKGASKVYTSTFFADGNFSKDEFEEWKKTLCEKTTASQKTEIHIFSMIQFLQHDVVIAWQECMHRYSSDLKCHIERKENDANWMTLKIFWFNKDLPLKITHFTDASNNLDNFFVDDIKGLGPMGEISLSYKRIDSKKSVAINIRGIVDNGQEEYGRTVSCSPFVPKEVKLPPIPRETFLKRLGKIQKKFASSPDISLRTASQLASRVLGFIQLNGTPEMIEQINKDGEAKIHWYHRGASDHHGTNWISITLPSLGKINHYVDGGYNTLSKSVLKSAFLQFGFVAIWDSGSDSGEGDKNLTFVIKQAK